MTTAANINDQLEIFNEEQINRLVDVLGDILKSKISRPQQIAETFADKVEQKTEEQIEKKVTAYKKKINKVEYINNCFRVAIEDQFNPEMVELIINCLDKGRKANDWGCMMAVYGKIKDNHKRQLILAISALYRLQFIDKATKDKQIRGRMYVLQSQLRYATICDECGKIAKDITQFLESKL